MADPRQTAERLRAWALEEGFDRAGVARVERPAHGDAFVRWLERGDQAGMSWLERRLEARLDPSRLLDSGAVSALCVALQYHPGDGGSTAGEAGESGDLWPRVARYARGRDYHRIFDAALRRLAERVRQAYPGRAARPYCDTGPVLERELAAAAGIGAVGKNTQLLHPEAGSWFLVGELFLDLELAPDPPLADLCGSCTRCLEACPTGALPEAYRLDSRRCISYWTIEHRGAFPEEVRPLLGDWVFGCDVCQEACPVNASPTPRTHRDLDLPPERAEVDLAGLLGLDRQGWLERFRASPMKRAKVPGLKRNAAVAMGNRGDRRYVEPLGRALVEEEPVVRRHAAWALGRIGGERAVELLDAALAEEADGDVRDELARAREAARARG